MTPPPGDEAAVRPLPSGSIDAFADFMTAHAQALGGSRSRRVHRAVAADAVRGDRLPVIHVTESAGEITGALVVLLDGPHRYWRSFAWQHPIAAAGPAYLRVRRTLTARWRRARSARSASPGAPAGGAAPAGRTLPEGLEDHPGLHRGASEEELAALSRTGREAYGAQMVVAPAQRGRGLAKVLLGSTFADLHRRGVDAFTGSIELDNGPMLRIYLALDFPLYRRPHGFYLRVRLEESGLLDPAG